MIVTCDAAKYIAVRVALGLGDTENVLEALICIVNPMENSCRCIA